MKVIFVVSAPRSGSTLLDMLLGSVDGFFSGGELRYLWQRGLIQQRRCGCGLEVSECVVWSKVLSAPGLSRLDPADVARWQHSVARTRHTRRLLQAADLSVSERDPQLSRLIAAMTTLYEETGHVTGARVIVDSSKRPADAALAALIPGVETYVVHLVRDPRAVAYSWRRRKPEFDHTNRPEMERRNVARVALNWLWHNAVTSTIPHYAPAVPFLRVRYEDVLTRPAASLARILAFAGEPGAKLPVHDRVASFRPNHTVSGNPSRFSTGEVELRLDEEWRCAMGAVPWCAATAISIPSIRRYDCGPCRSTLGARSDRGCRDGGRWRVSSLRRQGSWAVVDQVLSSGTNFVPGILLARALGPAGFGAFSLAFLVWFGALAILRAALMQPYTLAAAALEGPEWREITSHAGGVVVVGGVTFGAVFAIAAVIVGASSNLGEALLAVAVLAPGLALQEFWRVASFAAQRARTAAANDGFWALGQVVAFAFVLTHGNVSIAAGLFAWGIGGWLAAGLGTVQLSVLPRVGRASVRWAGEWARVGAWFAATTALYNLGALAIAITIAAKLGSADLGLFRTVQLLFGPVQLLTIGAEYVFLPHLVRAIKRTVTTGVGESWRYSVVTGGLTAAYGLVLLVAAHAVLTRVFGAGYADAGALVLPMLVACTLDAAWSGAALLLRARAKGGRLLVAQVAYTTGRVAAVAVLVNVGGLRGAGWGLAIGSGVAAFFFWTHVARTTVREQASPDTVESSLPSGLRLAGSDGSE